MDTPAPPPRLRLPPEHQPAADHFLDTMLYDAAAFLVTEVLEIDRERSRVLARMDTTRGGIPLLDLQRGDPVTHPRHVPAPALLLLTGNLGTVHAYFQHGVRFDEGWVGFGSRIHRADFKRLAAIGPPLELESVETRARISPERHVVRYEFHFRQEGKLVYYGDQTAMWLRGRSFEDAGE